MSTGSASAATSKTTWFIIFFALVVSVGIYGLLCFLMAQSRSTPSGNSLGTLRPIFYVLAGASLLASIAWMHFKTYGKIGGSPVSPATTAATLLSPQEFQTVSITGLAMAEACSIYGLVLFFIGAPIMEFARFAAGTLAVDLLYILPKGISYWAAWEMQQKSGEQPSSRA